MYLCLEPLSLVLSLLYNAFQIALDVVGAVLTGLGP